MHITSLVCVHEMDKHMPVSACHDMERFSDLYSEVQRGLSKSSPLFEGQLLQTRKEESFMEGFQRPYIV